MKIQSELKQIILFCALATFTLLSTACSLSTQGSSGTGANPQALNNSGDPIDDPLEIVEEPQLPLDDGIPMDEAEKIAFNSTGFLDVNLDAEAKARVERHFKYYLHDQRATFERYIRRAEVYLPYVRQVFIEKGVPEEIAYLAIVESGFNSRAVSRAGATGMWQFMSFTGKKYGLEQNSWMDERRDPYKATRAAADYLLKLYEMFGDWHLAIAAYNAGEGKIGRALEFTGASDFFELCSLNDTIPQYKARLRLETQQYVPRLLAVVKLMRNLEILGFDAPDEANALKVLPVKVGPGTDLGSLARNSGMSWSAFKDLNPAYRRTISPPSSTSTAYVPLEQGDRAVAWLAKAASSRFAGWQQYRVRRGDSLYAISSRHGVTVDVLRQANNLKGNLLREGTLIIVPGGKPAQTAVVKSAPTATKAVASRNSSTYTVKRGDSLYSIAVAHGASVSSIQQANNMSARQTRLMPGQHLNIPVRSLASAAPTGGGSMTVVRRGDTLYGIAMQYNTSVDEIVRLNGLTPGRPIMPGQEIRLP